MCEAFGKAKDNSAEMYEVFRVGRNNSEGYCVCVTEKKVCRLVILVWLPFASYSIVLCGRLKLLDRGFRLSCICSVVFCVVGPLSSSPTSLPYISDLLLSGHGCCSATAKPMLLFLFLRVCAQSFSLGLSRNLRHQLLAFTSTEADRRKTSQSFYCFLVFLGCILPNRISITREVDVSGNFIPLTFLDQSVCAYPGAR